ncbi:hypothetical protein EH243_16815 [Amphritea opalescens]|uniref:Zinc finger DksA/TraR C4-type domain-containing protein n=1 Tax=Amphritea opalescens TaxID=2490544 RepID=A0A430KMM3_9GAMM|nr:TraR/DksA C4-type zinc finger protein [Amphritea opalescens]RTE64613.1 hypothetical protein EH243_16815 [Amphritea opalescens]
MNTMKRCCTNELQLKHLKRELQVLLQQLQSDLDAERVEQRQEMSQLNRTEVLDRGEASSVVGLQQTSLSRIKQLEEEINECQNALERIEAGRYGYCEQCGEEIELNRLMANPTAVLCVRCQSKDELQRNGRSIKL